MDYASKEWFSEIRKRLYAASPHENPTYTYDDMGMAYLISDIYKEELGYCPQTDDWFIYEGRRWAKQTDPGLVCDMIQTVFNLLLEYSRDMQSIVDEDTYKAFNKFVHAIRKVSSIKAVMELLKTNLRMPLNEMDQNPYILNTPACAYDLKADRIIPESEIKACRLTKITNACRLEVGEEPLERWYDFIDEITSHDTEKAAFLQRALGYSLLGVNREECMFVAYGAKTRNGKGTLFSSIDGALGDDYSDGSSPKLICENKNGTSIDFNSPQPALCKLVGTRIVNMSEAPEGVRLDAAAMKSITGRDKLVTRGLYESAFSFVPQFTLWLNTNWLPSITDDTVFASDRIWVITFDEHFDGDSQDKDLKEIFSTEQARKTIIEWLYQGCREYFKQGLNPPECVRDATKSYRKMHDRVGCFLEECCDIAEGEKVLRGQLYQKYSDWCLKSDNRYKPIGSTTFYGDVSRRGFMIKKFPEGWYMFGLKLKDTPSLGHKIKLT